MRIDAAPATPDSATDTALAPAGAPGHKSAGAVARPAADGGMAGLQVSGSVPKTAAAKVVRGGAGKLRACYEKGRATNPNLRGRVSFKLTIDDRGLVTVGEVVTSTLGGGDAELCMVHAARDLRFPVAALGSGDSTVAFQMSFGR